MSRTYEEFTAKYNAHALSVLEAIAGELWKRGYRTYGPAALGTGLWGMAVRGLGMKPPDTFGIEREGANIYFVTPPAGERWPDASYAEVQMEGRDVKPHAMGLLLDPLERDDDRRWENLFRWAITPEHIKDYADTFEKRFGQKMKRSPKVWRPRR